MLLRLALLVGCLWAVVAPVSGQEAATAPRPKQPADALEGPPLVTAKGWVIGDGRSGKVLWGSEEGTARPIASTTKMMTAWLAVRLIDRDKTVLDQVVTFSERADKTNGSTAAIAAGERLTVRDLLYGLMLPSGNDAATAVAEHFGDAFATAKPADESSPVESVAAFVEEMNRTAKGLDMAETHYLDPHGLGGNRSSPRDLLRLAHAAMQSETFRRYVNTQRHEGAITLADGGTRQAVWNNTNRLLDIEGFDGVKTGTTTAAGACLVSSCHRGDDHLFVVVLGAATGDGRYVDTRNLLRWAWPQRSAVTAR